MKFKILLNMVKAVLTEISTEKGSVWNRERHPGIKIILIFYKYYINLVFILFKYEVSKILIRIFLTGGDKWTAVALETRLRLKRLSWRLTV